MNILFIGGNGRVPDANGVCIKNMACEMMSRGHKVWIISRGNGLTSYYCEQEGAQLIEVPIDLFRRLTLFDQKSSSILFHLIYKLVSILRHVILLPFYPNTSPLRSIRVAKVARKIVEENSISLVVCTFCPYENIHAGIKLKQRYGEKIKVISYHLDLRTANVSNSAFVRNYVQKYALLSIRYEQCFVDKILVPYSGRNELEKLTWIDNSKYNFVGFPLFLSSFPQLVCELPFIPNSINISYVGSLSIDNRNPQYILSLLEEISTRINKKVYVHFWGDMADTLPIIASSSISIYHGLIDNSYVYHIMKNSDLLLNIGNKLTYRMLPSKIFSMFAIGRPIINVISHPQDVTIPFFDRYGNNIDIIGYDLIRNDVDLLMDIIAIKIESPSVDVKEKFEDFTPRYICDKILN